MRFAVLAMALVLSACDGPPIEPTPKPRWTLSVTGVTYNSDVVVGDTVTITVSISNSGTFPNPGTTLRFSGFSDSTHLIGCAPACTGDYLFDHTSAYFDDGVAAGETADFQVDLLATDVGVAEWRVQVYDHGQGEEGAVVGAKGGTVVIR